MRDLAPITTRTTPGAVLRGTARWMVTFVGFPLGGFAAELLAGPVDGPFAALAGGLITGAILGAVQVWGLGRHRPPVAAWIAATGLGLMVGLGAGAAVVGYATSLGALAAQGSICGAAVGLAQAVVLRRHLRCLALAWPPVLTAIWAAGWAVTTSIGVQVDQRFTVFGSSGALVVTALTAILPITLSLTRTRTAATFHTGTSVHIGTERSSS